MRSSRKKRGFHRTAYALLRHSFMVALSALGDNVEIITLGKLTGFILAHSALMNKGVSLVSIYKCNTLYENELYEKLSQLKYT